MTSDDLSFYRDTIVPEAEFIAGALNHQLFNPLGYSLDFRPETLDVFQADENQRATAYSSYVMAGMPQSVAAQILGIELPAGMEYAELDTGLPEPAEPAFPQIELRAMQDDLRRWEKIARRKIKAGEPADYDFVSRYIPDDIAGNIKAALLEASTEEEVKAAFAAGFCSGWQGYP